MISVFCYLQNRKRFSCTEPEKLVKKADGEQRKCQRSV